MNDCSLGTFALAHARQLHDKQSSHGDIRHHDEMVTGLEITGNGPVLQVKRDMN